MDIAVNMEISIIMDDNLATETLNSYIRGYHAYMGIWLPLVGEELECEYECGNDHDVNAIAVLRDNMINRRVVGHVPLIYSEVFRKFLSLPGHKVRCRVTGKHVNRGLGLGLEIPAENIFMGNVKAIRWLFSKIEKMEKELDNRVNKCME